MDEVEAAAATFLGKNPLQELWREAFRKDPQGTREDLFPGGFRVSVEFPQQDWEVDEVEHSKATEERVGQAYKLARVSGRNFAEQARAEQEVMLRWKFGLLFAPQPFEARIAQATIEAAVDMASGVDAMFVPGSAYGRYSALYMLKVDNESMLKRHPELTECRDEFFEHLIRGPVPALRLPAILRAALAMTPNRKSRPGDGYDVLHLTRGLSRCDIVTADSGMTQMCRDFRLIPPGCTLFSARELDDLERALELVLAA